MLEVAAYIKDPKPILDAKEILCNLSQEKCTVSGRLIKLKLQSIMCKSILDALIYALMRHRALIVVMPSQSIDDYLFSINGERLQNYMDDEIAAAKILMSAENASPALHKVEIEFVTTIPPCLVFSPDIENISQIDPSIKRLIGSSLFSVGSWLSLYSNSC